MQAAKRMAGRWLAAAALALGLQGAQAYTVSLLPAVQTVLQGDVVTVTVSTRSDQLIDGVGAYNFDFVFDATILSFNSSASAFSLGAGSDFLDISDNLNGTLTVFEVSQLDVTALRELQLERIDGFAELVLFTLTFNTVSPGTTALGFTSGAMSDVRGDNEQLFGEFISLDTTITVLENLGVPTPGTLPLVLAAVLAGAMVRRRAG
jgi:hypothetical protein